MGVMTGWAKQVDEMGGNSELLLGSERLN